MKKSIFALSLMLGLGVTGGAVYAQQSDKLDVKVVAAKEDGGLQKLSNNGKWAVGKGLHPVSQVLDSYPRLFDVENNELINLWNEGDPETYIAMSALDVSDDGLVVGAYRGLPAIWHPDVKKWQQLPIPSNYKFEWGAARSVTPDGKYAVGYLATVFSLVPGSSYTEVPAMWKIDGRNVELVELKNVPAVGSNGSPNTEVRFYDISADGKLIAGEVSFTQPSLGYNFIYDVEKETWQPMGFTYDNGKFTPMASVEYTSEGQFSPNGRYYTGIVGGGTSSAVYVWDRETDEFSIVPESDGMLYGAIGDDGVVYASEPSDTPIRNWKAYVGKYWYDWKTIAQQVWGFDWASQITQDEDGLTGTVASVDASGKVILADEYSSKPIAAYVMTLPATIKEVAPSIDLLARHYVLPVDGASFSTLREVTAVFDRDVDVLGDRADVKVYDADGNVVRSSIGFSVSTSSPRQVVATFRNFTMETGKTYKVVIPAGSICIAGDPERCNKEISVTYVGRPATPVSPVTISPESGNAIDRINVTSNPVVITFDSDLSLVENEEKILLQIDEDGEWAEVCALSGQIEGNVLRIFPVNEQELAKGSSYRIVIPANKFADLSGSNPNEEIIIYYDGSYENVTPIDKNLFVDDFSNGLTTENWMFFEGDGNTPNETMYSWDFTPDTTPWWFVRDDVGSTDWAACSHSMYSPMGQSFDWMVTKRILIPDEKCVLKFKSQSYLKHKEDRLKVYVWATDRMVTALTNTVVNDIFNGGVKVYDEVQSPGANEETLAGEWRENIIDLKDFAGKYVYVAFLNDNTNQSAIFVDDVYVIHDISFSATVDVPASVVNKESVAVSGSVNVEVASEEVYSEINLKLLDAEGNLVDEINPTGLSLKNGDVYKYEFAKQLPLKPGKVNKFSVSIKLGEDELVYNGSVTDLLFNTTRRVVLEENTGTNCTFCPQGHAVIERLDEMYGDLFIPVAIHGYTGGSQFATSFSVDYSQFLNMSAAPSGVINRTVMAAPMDRDGNNWYFTGRPSDLWYDVVAKEFNTPADADIDIEDVVIDDANNSIAITAKVKYAYEATNLNVNLFTVLLEDGLYGIQTNGIYSYESDALGEWGKGGRYGSSAPIYEFPHVVRGYQGTTYNGTGGYIPANVEAGKEYVAKIAMPLPSNVFDMNKTKAVVMMIDANSGKIINAARKASRVESNSVDGIESDASAINVVARGSEVVVYSPADAEVEIYSIDGKVIGRTAGYGEIAVDLSSHRGIAIVRVVADGESVVKKVFVK